MRITLATRATPRAKPAASTCKAIRRLPQSRTRASRKRAKPPASGLSRAATLASPRGATGHVRASTTADSRTTHATCATATTHAAMTASASITASSASMSAKSAAASRPRASAVTVVPTRTMHAARNTTHASFVLGTTARVGGCGPTSLALPRLAQLAHLPTRGPGPPACAACVQRLTCVCPVRIVQSRAHGI